MHEALLALQAMLPLPARCPCRPIDAAGPLTLPAL